MLSFNEITKSYQEDFWKTPSIILDKLSFSVKEGAVTGFLGANGAGKTTSMRVMMDFTSPDSGNVFYSDVLGNNKKERWGNLGYLPERPYFYPDLTGRDFVRYMGSLQGLKKRDIDQLARPLCEQFQIDFALDRKIKAYSKGMLQRIGFVSVLLHDPRLVILDEPLSGLDPIGRKELKGAIRDLSRNGKTVFFSSHIVSDVEEICENVIFIEKGKLGFEGSIEELITTENENFEISYLKNGKIELIEVKSENKERIVSELINSGAKINSLNKAQKTLEEVIYKDE